MSISKKKIEIVTLAVLILASHLCLAQYNIIGKVQEFNLISIDGNLGLIDETNNTIIEPDSYTKIEFDPDIGFFKCFINNEFALFDFDGNRVIDDLVSRISFTDVDGEFIIKTRNGMGVINVDGQELIPTIYDNITLEIDPYHFAYYTYTVEKNGKKGIYIDGNLAMNVEYDAFKRLNSLNEFIIVKDGKMGLAVPNNGTPDFHELLKPEYDDIYQGKTIMDMLVARVRNGKNFGLYLTGSDYYTLSDRGRFIVPIEYQKIDWDKRVDLESMRYAIPIIKDKAKGFIIANLENVERSPILVKSFNYDKNYTFIARSMEGKYGIIALDDVEWLVKPDYDEVKFFENEISGSYYALMKDGKWGVIDIETQEIIADFEHKSFSSIKLRNQ
jgi:hypothetical protein